MCLEDLFPQVQYDYFSLATTPVELMREGNKIAHGTGFLWRHHNGSNYLITNWHNFTGKNPFDNTFINNGQVPDAVVIYPCLRHDHNGGWHVFRIPMEAPLYEHYDAPAWLQHPDFAAMRIDVVAFPVNHAGEGSIITLQDVGQERLFTNVGSDLFIIGYPFPDYSPPHFLPIWKKGTIATEPLDLWNGRPAFLADAASRKGMSGSPVIRRVFGPPPIVTPNGLQVMANNVVTSRFIGIYSGHLSANFNEITLGIVWHAYCVDQIIQAQSPGTRD